MEIKDILGLVFSGLAIVLSIIATIISVVRSRYEKKRILRTELTEALRHIISGTLDNAKLYREAADDPEYLGNVSSILNQQNAFLLNEAIYLIDQIPELVTSTEYDTIAAANANSGHIILAEKFYRKAIEAASTDYYKALTLRSYARFVFSQRRFEEGREHFRKSIASFKGGDNLVRITNGWTYQIWAWCERNFAHAESRVDELLESAKTELNGIDNDFAKLHAMNVLEATRMNQGPPSPMSGLS